MAPRDLPDARVYRKNIDGEQILLGRRVESNEAVEPFLKAMERYSPGYHAEQAQTIQMQESNN
jgi:hypothetical protein